MSFNPKKWSKKNTDSSNLSIEDQRGLFEIAMSEKGIPGYRLMKRTDGKYSYNYVQREFEEFCRPENKITIDDTTNDMVEDIVSPLAVLG